MQKTYADILFSKEGFAIHFVPLPDIPPSSSLKFSVEPSTVAAAVGAAVEYVKGGKEIEWKASVSSKLDYIISQLNNVIDELRSLRVWIKEALLEESRRILLEEIDSHRKSVEDIIVGYGGVPDEEAIKRLTNLYTRIKVATDRLCRWQDYGFVQFQGVISGALTVLLVCKHVKIPEAENREFISRVVAYLEEASNILNEKSIAYARNQLALECGQQRAFIYNMLDKWWLLIRGSESRRVGGSSDAPDNNYFYWTRISLSGDPDGSIVVSNFESKGGRGSPDDPFYPGVPHFNYNEAEAAKVFVMNNIASLQRTYFGIVQFERRALSYLSDIQDSIAEFRKLPRA